ncbi:MAG: nucleotidyl transferase AbiEii/AbiGii toxin family protein [bacterium]
MLTLKQILSYTTASRITKNILTEYYQHELLSSLFSQNNSEFFSFIGGTAIRICYGGIRFSQDLDFDTSKLDASDELLKNTIIDMTAKGFVIESRLVHKGTYHCYLKFPHVLKSFGISGYSEEKLLIKIDATTCQSFQSTPHILNKYGVFETIKVAPASTILSKKLLTIGERKRPKGRDLYDVTYLWGLTEPDIEYLQTVAEVSLKDQLRKLIKYVDTLNLSDLARDVAPFLLNLSDSKRITNFGEFLKSKI